MGNVTPNSDIDEFVEAWDLDAALMTPETNRYDLADAMAHSVENLDIDIEEVYNKRFVQSASGHELGMLGELVGVEPKSNEENKRLRKRVQLTFAAKSSDTTIRNIATVTASALDIAPQDILIHRPPDTPPGQIEIEVPSKAIDDSPLTASEIEQKITEAVPAGHRALIVETGSFRFEGDDSGDGFDGGTWSETL